MVSRTSPQLPSLLLSTFQIQSNIGLVKVPEFPFFKNGWFRGLLLGITDSILIKAVFKLDSGYHFAGR